MIKIIFNSLPQISFVDEIFGINENDYLKLKNNVENLETQYSKCVQEEKELKEKLAVWVFN